jgi:hypothetical protein
MSDFATLRLPDGTEASFNIPKDLPDDRIIDHLTPTIEAVMKERSLQRQNIYDDDRGVTINAPVGATADQITYDDAVDNLGDKPFYYVGYKKVTDKFDDLMDYMSLPMDSFQKQTLDFAAGLSRYSGSLGFSEKEATDAIVKKLSDKSAEVNADFARKYKEADAGFGTDVFIGGINFAMTAKLLLMGKAGMSAFYGFHAISGTEEIYKELQEKDPDNSVNAAAAGIAGFGSAAVVMYAAIYLL